MKFSMKEMLGFVSAQKKIFEIVRLVDVSMSTQYLLSDDGKIEEQPYKCYSVWNKNMRCENCISAKAYELKDIMTKFEFVDNEIYLVMSSYVVVDNNDYMLEMVTKLNDETLFGAYGKNKFIKTIEGYNRKLYIDSLTGAYNRRYYDEQLKKLPRLSAVAMIDVDNFKKINDAFGHTAGDEVLKEIVKNISSCVRPVDAVVRMGGDEFLLAFQNISEEVLKTRLENIRQSVSSISISEYPDLRVSVSIGAVHSEKYAASSSELADKCLYKAKENKNALLIIKE